MSRSRYNIIKWDFSSVMIVSEALIAAITEQFSDEPISNLITLCKFVSRNPRKVSSFR